MRRVGGERPGGRGGAAWVSEISSSNRLFRALSLPLFLLALPTTYAHTHTRTRVLTLSLASSRARTHAHTHSLPIFFPSHNGLARETSRTSCTLPCAKTNMHICQQLLRTRYTPRATCCRFLISVSTDASFESPCSAFLQIWQGHVCVLLNGLQSG